MRELLVITSQPSIAEAVKVSLDPAKYAVVAKESARDAEALLTRGMIDAILLDAELTDIKAIRAIEEIRGVTLDCPILVLTAAKQWEWEEDAFVLGVAHVLMKPLRARLLNALLDPLFTIPQASESRAPAPDAAPAQARQSSGVAAQFQSLAALRNFSGVLTHSLQPDALLRQFLLHLREIIGVNRAAIFLRKSSEFASETASAPADRSLRSACAIGLEPSLLAQFALSLDAGIGRHLKQHGRILRASGPEAKANPEISREFRALGAQTAIPILDRESLIGVAVFDDRLTGEPYASEELALIFHVLEEVGLAVRNSWLHDELNANHALIADIFANLECGCVLVGSGPSVLQANAAARKFLFPMKAEKAPIEFADLPQVLGSKVFTVMKTGESSPPFRCEFEHAPGASYRATINPFKSKKSGAVNAALLILEDVTQAEKSQRLEIEASKLRLITSMAEHLAHEIGNSLVPISTHQQLLENKFEDAEFRQSLSEALESGVKRISRLANQMVFLARDKTDFADKIRVSELIVEAFREAHTFFADKIARLNFDKSSEPWMIAGDHKALRHAFSEVMLNALQANPGDPNVAVSVEESKDESGGHLLHVDVRDAGAGFSPETAEKAQEPFFSTRNVGLGLGLTVTRKIIESHRGSVEINPSRPGQHGVVRISLPLSE
jgi:signal transduction histidine kinase/DNA-binding response OmpR family regulator